MRWLPVISTSGIVAFALGCRGGPEQAHGHAAPAPACSVLAPDLAVVRHRFSNAPAPDSELATTIRDLEVRVNAPAATPFDLTDLAELYFRRGQLDGDVEDYQASEAMARRSLALLPFPNGAALTLAKLASARHDFRAAITIGRQHLTRKGSAGTYIVLASAHLALGELGEAIGAAESAVARSPGSSTYLMRALVMQAQGRDAEAAFDFARAATVETHGDPYEAARIRTLWGRFLLRRGELAGAALLFDEALRIVPAYPLALAQRAELALRHGRWKEARGLFEQAFAASRQVRYLMDLGRAQELSGDPVGADRSRTLVETIVRAELEDHGYGHQLDLVELLVDRGTAADLAAAVPLAREELGRRPSAETRFQLARALARLGARDEAMTHVRAALATGARDARLYELAARVETGPRAALYAREAEALDPGGSGWRQLGMGR